MSELTAVVVPIGAGSLGARDVDIVREIADLARSHRQGAYFARLAALPPERQLTALQDAAVQIAVVIREFSVCHDLALSQVVRAGRGSAALQNLLLSGGLDSILRFDPSGQLSMARYFARFLIGVAVAGKAQTVAVDARVLTVRHRLTALSGSERAGVGLGALAAFFSLSHLVVAGFADVPARQGGTPRAPVEALVMYRDLLDTAVHDVARAVPGRRALAFGATQACALADELFGVLIARI